MENVTISQDDTSKALFRVTGNSAVRGWGTAGANGGEAVIHAKDQTLSGRIVTDTISKLDLDGYAVGGLAVVRRQKRTAPFL